MVTGFGVPLGNLDKVAGASFIDIELRLSDERNEATGDCGGLRWKDCSEEESPRPLEKELECDI